MTAVVSRAKLLLLKRERKANPFYYDSKLYGAPLVTALTPSTIAVAGANFTLHVFGLKFDRSSVINYNGVVATTTYVSATELTTPINMTGATVGAKPVKVRNSTGKYSNVVNFTITA